MSVNLYKWQNQMCPIKSFWKEKQLCISLFLLLLLMIIYITPGSQVFGHVLIANSWRRYQIAVAARRLEGRLGNASPLWSNLMWPQANLALDTAQGVQSDQRDHWLCPCGSLCPGKNSSVRGLRMSGLQQRELQPTGRQDWGEGADLICLWRGRCWTFPLTHLWDFQPEIQQHLLLSFNSLQSRSWWGLHCLGAEGQQGLRAQVLLKYHQKHFIES